MNDLREKIAEIKKEYETAFPKEFYNWSEYGFWLEKLSDIASLISQHSENKGEQLEVRIVFSKLSESWYVSYRNNRDHLDLPLFSSITKDEVLAFCAKHNLKVVVDE